MRKLIADVLSARLINPSPLTRDACFCHFIFSANLPAAIISLHARFVSQISEAVSKNQFDRAVREESEFIIECGISKFNWDFSEKSELELLLCKRLVIYRNKAALDQFLEGLQRVGLLKYVKENPTGLKEVFCCMSPFPLTVDSFRKLLRINYSDPSSNRGNQAREGEEATILWWEEFLDNLDQSDPLGLLPQLPTTFPFWDFPKNIDIEDFFSYRTQVRSFSYGFLLRLELQLPRGIHSFDEFEGLTVRVLKEGSHGLLNFRKR